MDTSYRKLHKIKWVLNTFSVVALLYMGGCVANFKGGAGIFVDEKCNGLDELGYKAPFSSQDIEDIEALGFNQCAQHIRDSK